MKNNIFAILIILLFIFPACSGKDKVKPSADSLLTTDALSTIHAVRTAYEEKDHDFLKNHLVPELAEDISKELSFEKAELSFTPKMVKITDSTITVDLNWKGSWVVKGDKLQDRGAAVFVLDGSPMKLIRLIGDNPFHTP